MLTDSYNRIHQYLRISITDQCNFRCTYCMPDEQMKFMKNHLLMTVDEIFQLAELFVGMGIKKIRLTGGEPLVRKDVKEIIQKLSVLPVELTLTSNGVFIEEHLDTLRQAKIRSVNISLDSLNPEKFSAISNRNALEIVWNNVLLLIQNNIHVKLNMVVMKGINENEIIDFAELTKNHPVHVRFIEFMPFTGNTWNSEKVITQKEILRIIEQKYSFTKLKDEKHETAKKYQINGHSGTFAIITTMSEPFCSDCNRLRITADGKIKNCLFSAEESDLLGRLRKGEDLTSTILQSVQNKKEKLGGQFTENYKETDAGSIVNRSMINIGG